MSKHRFHAPALLAVCIVFARAASLVDLVCRSFAGDATHLRVLVHSIEIYWPREWGVAVVLDDDPADIHFGRTLPSFVSVFYESPPKGFEAFPELRSRGYLRAQWSMFQLDRYSSAEFVAFVDSDVVFFTWIVPSLLFRDGLPIIRAMSVPYFWLAVFVLGWPWVSEFMLGFPFVLRRDLFPRARDLILGTMQAKSYHNHWPPIGEATSFDAAFLALALRLEAFEIVSDHDLQRLPCAQTLLGHAAFLLDHDRYAWSILPQEALPLASEQVLLYSKTVLRNFHSVVPVPVSDNCPALMPAVHLGYWISSKLGGTNPKREMTPGLYHEAAGALMLLGHCGDFDYSNTTRSDPVCATVQCNGCPGALYRTLSMAEEQRRITWGLVADVPDSCPSAYELLRTYSHHWAHMYAHSRPNLSQAGTDQTGGYDDYRRGLDSMSCTEFCELLGAKQWFRHWGLSSHYEYRVRIDATAPDWRCELGLHRWGGVVNCPSWA